MGRLGRLLVPFIVVAAVLTPAAAKPKKAAEGDAVTVPGTVVVFTASERRTIQSYFAAGGESAKPLPPGIAKKVARGGTLPPGIAKRYLPQGLDARLPPPAPGCERLIVGTDVLLVEISTGAILDMISHALR